MLKYHHLAGGLEHGCYFSIYWEVQTPNWQSPSFFRGVGLNHQPAMICYKHWYTIGPIGFYAEIYDFSSHHRWNLGCRWPASAASRRMPWSTCCGPVTWHRKSGWWFGTWLLFFHNIMGIILPNWLSYFSRWLKSPTSIPEKKRFPGNDNWHEWWFISSNNGW